MEEVDVINPEIRKELKIESDTRSKRICRKKLEGFISRSNDMSQDLVEIIQGWICDDRNWDVKDEILMDYFEKLVNDHHEPTEEDRRSLRELTKKLGFPEDGD